MGANQGRERLGAASEEGKRAREEGRTKEGKEKESHFYLQAGTMKARESGTAMAPEGPSRRRHGREMTERITRILSCLKHSKESRDSRAPSQKIPGPENPRLPANSQQAARAGSLGHCASQGEKHAMELGFPGCWCRACMSRARNPTGPECRAQHFHEGTVAGPTRRWG